MLIARRTKSIAENKKAARFRAACGKATAQLLAAADEQASGTEEAEGERGWLGNGNNA